MNSTFIPYVTAMGGIGNRLNSWLCGQAYGTTVFWDNEQDPDPRPEDLLEDVEPDTYKLRRMPRSRLPHWRFPGINADNLPPEHPPVDANCEHWKFIMPSAPAPMFRRPKTPDIDIPPGCRGVSFRFHHPDHKWSLAAARDRVNRMTEDGPVFVASDAVIPGLSSAVIVNRLVRRGMFDYDRDAARTSAEWRAIQACSVIHTSLVNSTFTNYATFVLKTPTLAL